jgi:catechol 2,3-dioxygenase-like lactoylglutathione lyase family enzyme
MIASLDHLVLTTRDLDRCLEFYTGVLGMSVERFALGRLALHFGSQKINLHQAGHEFEPKAASPTPGALDLCFLADRPLAEVIARLEEQGVQIVEGPVERTGACFRLLSVYVRDPDGNLVEIAVKAD